MQLNSSLISFNHHFDSPVIPTKGIAKKLKVNDLAILLFCFSRNVPNGGFNAARLRQFSESVNPHGDKLYTRKPDCRSLSPRVVKHLFVNGLLHLIGYLVV